MTSNTKILLVLSALLAVTLGQATSFLGALWAWTTMAALWYSLTILRVLLILEALNMLSLIAASIKGVHYTAFLAIMIISAGEAVIGLALLASTLRTSMKLSSSTLF